MAMSKRSGGEKQEDIWIAHTEFAVPPGHPFYTRLNDLLEGASFDEFVRDYVRASIMRDWDDHRYALGFTFGRCWWGISRASMVSAGSRGGRQIRCRCSGFC
jgi:hypothetical protein